jgi:hypothetical protein
VKTIFVCDNCGSTHVFIDAYSALNWEEVRTYDWCVCMGCDRDSWPVEVEVPDDTDVENYTHPITRDKA